MTNQFVNSLGYLRPFQQNLLVAILHQPATDCKSFSRRFRFTSVIVTACPTIQVFEHFRPFIGIFVLAEEGIYTELFTVCISITTSYNGVYHILRYKLLRRKKIWVCKCKLYRISQFSFDNGRAVFRIVVHTSATWIFFKPLDVIPYFLYELLCLRRIFYDREIEFLFLISCHKFLWLSLVLLGNIGEMVVVEHIHAPLNIGIPRFSCLFCFVRGNILSRFKQFADTFIYRFPRQRDRRIIFHSISRRNAYAVSIPHSSILSVINHDANAIGLILLL